ncbi:ubiquinol-cytochrome C chaperone family protein [Helicobacter cetorum]|uniref:ubiquinol-cytochrome C chaperone family protein n=1 Tax=Helicobacter cetorum TaxID=138563 RepID=UPI000CF195EE|nr:ubiquinol-cytochrome C chaperone family protein [Helicobacter cetorum]
MKVGYDENAPIEEIERAMLESVIAQGFEKMSESEIKEMCCEISKKHVFDFESLDKQALIANIIHIFVSKKAKDMDFILKLTSFITADVIKVVGAGVGAEFLSALAPNALRGPAGWVLGIGVVAKLLSDPAFRVTIPACFVVATLRLKASAKKSLFSLPFF